MATTTTALDEVIALLPAQDMYTITGHSGTTLTDAMLLWYGIAESEDPPLVLNPDFSEALLGLPEGWTSVDDESACAALGMRSAQIKLF